MNDESKTKEAMYFIKRRINQMNLLKKHLCICLILVIIILIVSMKICLNLK
jgi:hypothetical protein